MVSIILLQCEVPLNILHLLKDVNGIGTSQDNRRLIDFGRVSFFIKHTHSLYNYSTKKCSKVKL